MAETLIHLLGGPFNGFDVARSMVCSDGLVRFRCFPDSFTEVKTRVPRILEIPPTAVYALSADRTCARFLRIED